MNLPKAIMFYDGGCPLCRREIKHYRRLDSANRIDWIDISRDASLVQAMGVTLDTAMARLHVLHRDGWLATGAYAFAVVWSELPYYRWLARLVYGLGLLPLLDSACIADSPAGGSNAAVGRASAPCRRRRLRGAYSSLSKKNHSASRSCQKNLSACPKNILTSHEQIAKMLYNVFT